MRHTQSLTANFLEEARKRPNTHLVGLNLRNEVFERRETAQPHDRLGLLHGQALDLGRRASTQDDLLPSQEVLKLSIVGGLPGGGDRLTGVPDSLLPRLKERSQEGFIPFKASSHARRRPPKQGGRPYPMAPFSLILASSMAKVMWSWCSMPLATRLNATWGRERATLRSLSHDLPPSRPDRAKRRALYLEEILRYDGEALRVVGDALEVGVLVQNVVINVQEELQGVLVQEVDLEGGARR